MCVNDAAEPSPYRAAIDIGTNSMHLVVARLGEHGGFEMLTSEKEMVRLGQGGGEMKQLAPEAIDRGIAALSRMAKVAASFGEVQLDGRPADPVRPVLAGGNNTKPRSRSLIPSGNGHESPAWRARLR